MKFALRCRQRAFAALLGGHLLGEGDRVARLVGAACIGLGVVALSWT